MIMNLNWKKVKQQGQDIPRDFRAEHSLTYLKRQNSLLLFGQSLKKNEIFSFSLDQLTWTSQPTQGRKPTSRSFYASYYDEKEQILYIHGGQAEPRRSLDDFHALYVKSWTWKKIFSEIPHGRHGHRMVGHLGNKIIHGGVREPENQFLNDTWIVKGNLKYTQQPELHGFVFEKLNTKGAHPRPRKHYQSFVYKNQMFVIGGQTGEKKANLSIYSLSLVTYTWTHIQAPKNIKQRSNFSLIAKDEDHFLIFGGVQCQSVKSLGDLLLFDAKSLKIQTLSTDISPSPRSNHSMCTTKIHPFRSFMMGGSNKLQPLQIYQLYEQDSFNQISASNYEEYITQLQAEISKQEHQSSRLQKYLGDLSQPPENSNVIQHLLTLIKSEQLLSQELQKKDTILEQLLKQVQNYMHILYENYMDYGEESHEIESAKQNHIYICLKLKDAYMNIEKLNRRNLSKVQEYRSGIVRINRQFQGFMETEVDEEDN